MTALDPRAVVGLDVAAGHAGASGPADRWAAHGTQAPDPAAFEHAVSLHYPSLVRRLVTVLGDPQAAEDVAQETYLRAFRSWDSFDGTDLRGWLFTIALRLAFNERRRARRWLAAIRRVEPRPAAAPSDPDLWAALGRLDVRTRSVLLLNAVDGYTQREIAVILGVPEGTVASWLSRGRAVLRTELIDRAGSP
jgi:RNA polymerase sigma-70 factor, ECF subfamily